jgi:hypothetical protein
VDAFATVTDLTGDATAGTAGWLSAAQAALLDSNDAARILERATEVVAEAVTTGYYTDDLGNPTDDTVIEALRKACCAQVEQWLEVGEENDIAGYSRSATMSVGGLNLSELPSILAPRARRILRLAGLTGAVAY